MVNQVVESAKNHIIKLEKKKKISKKNKELIIGFIEKLQAEGHSKGAYSANRLRKYVYALSTITKILNKDFDKAKKKDINKLASIIRERYNGETPRDYLVMLRIFMRYVKELEGNEFEDNEYPDIVKKIKPGNRKFPRIKKSTLLTIEDVKKLANATNNLRDRCFVLTLYETGCRIGELIGDENYSGVRIGDIKFDKHGAIIDVDGKTGLRNLRVIASAPSISNWLQEHPERENPNTPLFCGIWDNKGKKVKYRYWYDLLNGNNFKKKLKQGDRGKGLGEKAGINKPLNPHHFRHSRASELAKFMTESQLCYYMGWEQGSKQARTYVTLSGRDTEKTILSMYGIKDKTRFCEKCKNEIPETIDNEEHKGKCPNCKKIVSFVTEEEINSFKPKFCPRCNIKNDPSAKYCSGCGLGLDEKSIMEFDRQQEKAKQIGNIDMEMIKDPKFREFYNEILGQTLEKYREMKEK